MQGAGQRGSQGISEGRFAAGCWSVRILTAKGSFWVCRSVCRTTKKQRFCALVHGSARLDDHAIIGDVTHERTVQRRVRQRTHELWMGTFTSGRARRSDSNQAFSLCPLVIRQERGMRHGAVHPPVLGHGCGEDLKGAYLVNMKFAELCVH